MAQIPPLRNMYELIKELDWLAAHKPTSGQPLPILFFLEKNGTIAQRILSGFRDRLLSEAKTSLVPHAFISKEVQKRIDDDDIALYNEIERQFQDAMPQSMGDVH